MQSSDDSAGRITPDLLEKLVRVADVDELTRSERDAWTGDVELASGMSGEFGAVAMPIVNNGEVVYGWDAVAAEQAEGRDDGRMVVVDITGLDWPRERVWALVAGLHRRQERMTVDQKALADLLLEIQREEPALLDAIMRELERAQLVTRVRISSLNPDAVSDELVEQFRIHRSLCPHLHLALQSGSDAVLRRMRRPYLSADLISSVRRLRSFDANFALTTDIIVGFPGETEGDFLDTVDAVRTSAFAKVHVFPFSPRPFTPAARDPGQVSPATIRERVHRMLAVGAETGLHYAQRFIGRDATIISEKVGPGRAEGYSEYYLWTEVRCEPQTMPARDILLQAAVDSCRYEGDRVILTGSVRS